jgi:hypothetical protein
MLRTLFLLLGLTLPLLLPKTTAAGEAVPPPAQWIPKDALAVLEVSRPKPLLDLALSQKTAAAVSSLPGYQKRTAEPGFKQFLGAVRYLEGSLNTDWRQAVQKLLGGGLTLAAMPNGSVLLVADTEDKELLERLHGILLGFAKGDAANKGKPERVTSEKYHKATLWTFGGDEWHAIVGARLIVSNRAAALKAALDQADSPEGASLASLPAFQAARKAAPAKAVATAFLNMAALRNAPQFKQALGRNTNPLATLLFAGLLESLGGSNWLAVGLSAEGETLSLHATSDGKPVAAAAFARPKQGEGAFPQLAVPRRIAAMSFYRDLKAFYAAKDKLFPDRTSGLIFFENMMGIFFTGRDLTDEVLAETLPEVRVVVAEQEYDPAIGAPLVKLPAFAAVFRLRHPKEFGEVTEEAWQKALGLINFTRGQKAQPGLVLDRDIHNGTKFSLSYFSASAEKTKKDLDVRFNLRPSLAKPGEYVVLSSTDGLAKDLIDVLKKETAEPVKPMAAHSTIELDAARLSSVLGANRANMVRQNMVEKGTTQAEAEGQIDMLTTLLKRLGQATLAAGERDGQMQAKLTVKLNLD